MAGSDWMTRNMPDTMSAGTAPTTMSNDCAVPAAAVSANTYPVAASMPTATVSPAAVASTSMSAAVAAATMTAASVSAATMPPTMSAATVSTAATAGVCFECENRHYDEQRGDRASRGHQHWHCSVARLGTHCRFRLARILPETKSF
jgi:hypothetical protein